MNHKEVLQTINWFSDVGEKIDESVYEIPVQQAKDVNDCIKNINSLKWENFILYVRNRLSAYIQHFHKADFKQWNAIAAEARTGFDPFKPKIQEAAIAKGLPEVIVTDIRSILISYQIEGAFLQLTNPAIPQQLDKIVKVYTDGKIPCGWNGKLPKNEGYQPINFNEGKTIVW